MEYPDPEAMVKALVKEHSNMYVIRQMVRDAFGTSPSIPRISAFRGAYLREVNGTQGSRYSYRPVPYNAKPMPEDFAKIAPTMNKSELQRHYQVKWSGTIDRWLKEAGVQARKFIPHKGRIHRMGMVPSKGLVTLERVKDPDEVAADILRKERFPVNRCNENGSFNANGKFWRIGINVYTKEGIIERAKKYG